MEVIKSKDYHKKSAEAADILKSAGDSLESKYKQELEIQVARGEVLRKVEAIAGTDSNVFASNDNADANVAGFYEWKSNLKNKTLDDLQWATHVNNHENLHPKVLSNVEINKYISSDHAAPIVASLQEAEGIQGIKTLEDINWVEGFTELINIMENGEHVRCAYNKLEVPAAKELERLCMEHTGESLVDAFKTKNVGMFYYRLRRLADCMLLNETADEMETEMEKASSNVVDISELIAKRLNQGHLSVDNKKDAKKVVGKILEDAAAIENIRTKLAA